MSLNSPWAKRAKDMGCGLGQGFLLARPKTATEVAALLFSLRADVSPPGATWKPAPSALMTLH